MLLSTNTLTSWKNNMKKKNNIDSLQSFGYNRFNLRHSVLGSYNMGIAYPLGWRRVKIGDTLSNNIDSFSRSSALADPSFLDAELSIGHYFVPYAAIDPLYYSRTAKFKGTGTDVQMPYLTMPTSYVYDSITKEPFPAFAPGSLLDHLKMSFGKSSLAASEARTLHFDIAPVLAYHMILDTFFTNSKIQNSMYTRTFITETLSSRGFDPYVTLGDLTADQGWSDTPTWDVPFEGDSSANFFALRYINNLPDYFTTARRSPGGPSVSIPSSAGTPGTIHELLDAMLQQKVGDALQRGGFSYADYARVIFGVTDITNEAIDPIFLAGSSGPLQVSTVVTQSTDNLGEQGGNVTGSSRFDNGFTHTFSAEGIYMPILFIRPSTYYAGGVSCEFSKTTIASRVIPQLADLSDDAIMISEISSDPEDFISDYNTSSKTSNIFGYKDRYEEQRCEINRAVGELRTTRKGWYIARTPWAQAQSNLFISQEQLLYTPWVITDNSVDHFFIRSFQNLEVTQLLPQSSAPWVW